MNIIIFNKTIGGHHLEYIHHIYEMGLRDKDNHYVFVLPRRFETLKEKWEWNRAENVEFDLFDDFDTRRFSSFISMLRDSWSVAGILKKYVIKHNADIIYSNYLIATLPFAPIRLPRECKMIGIIYRIYLYQNTEKFSLSLLLEKLKFWILSNCRIYKRILILNDESSTKKLNHIWRTTKFTFIPDPYIPIKKDKIYNFRNRFGIDDTKVVFAHIGAMSYTKSSLEILESILSLPPQEADDYCFVFAGVVQEEIRHRFYELYESVKNIVQIILIDKYCSYEDFGSLCVASNAILIPYKRTLQSSGVIGYASQFKRPVIAADSGLLGSLVKKYNMGLLLEKIDNNSLMDAYRKVALGEVVKPDSSYCYENGIELFQDIIYKSICQE